MLDRRASDSGFKEYALEIKKDRGAILEAIADQPQYHTNLTEKGLEKFVKKAGKKTKYLDKRFE